MRKTTLFYSLFIVIFIQTSIAQNGLHNYGNTIKNSNSIKIYDGDLSNSNNGRIENDGNIYIEGDIYNNSTNTCFVTNNTGNVILESNEKQYIGGSGSSIKFENLIINNTSSQGVEISNNNQIIENTLYLNSGVITTNNFNITTTNTNSTAIVNYSNQSFINGNLRRYITSNTETYAFPIGDSTVSSNYYLAEFVNNNITGIDYIDSKFTELIDTDFENITAQDNSSLAYSSINTEGLWELTPNSAIASGTYDLKLYIENFTGLIDNRFAILSRPNTSTTAADWDCTPCGIGTVGISNDSGDGRMVSDGYAMRMGYNHFTEFGIATASCPMPSLQSDTLLCFGDSLLLYPGDFTSYLWSTGSTDSSIYVGAEGEYAVDLTTNIAGCETTADTINIEITKIESNITSRDITCYGYNNGLIYVNATGGTPTYNYTWNPSATNTDSIFGLSPNTYSLTITDNNGCTEVINKIDIQEPDSLYLMADITDNKCFNDSVAQININPYGGTPNYHYNWNTGSEDESLTNLTDGTYSVTLSDENNCETSEQFILASSATEIIINDETGIDGSNFGYIYTDVEGGTPSYEYSWSYDENNTTGNAENLYTGIYYLTVTDFNNCKKIKEFNIEMELIIPTVITPNGDNYNDTWDIVNLETFNDVKIFVYNRWGDQVFEYSGTGLNYRDNTSLQWNGIWKGKKLPLSSYVYIVKLENKEEINGVVTIVY